MQGHVVALLAANQLQVEWRNHYSGTAYRRLRKIAVPPVRSTVTYWLALHELGHLLGKRQGYAIRRLDKEAHAWQWALDNALAPPDGKAAAKIGASLHSYLCWAWNRQGRRRGRPWLPPRRHLFWVLYLRYYNNPHDNPAHHYMGMVLGG